MATAQPQPVNDEREAFAVIEALPEIDVPKDLIERANQWPEIRTAQDYAEADKVQRELLDRCKGVKSLLETAKKKAHGVWKEICNLETAQTKPLESARSKILARMDRYVREEQERKDREAREAAAAARKEAEAEAERRALALAEQGKDDEAEAVIEQTISAPAPVVVPDRVAPAASGSKTVYVWEFRVHDPAAFYRALAEHPNLRNLAPIDDAKVRTWLKATDGGYIVPGLDAKKVPKVYAK